MLMSTGRRIVVIKGLSLLLLLFLTFSPATLAQVGTARPNPSAGFSGSPIIGSVDRWYDPTAFALQAPGTLGALGRNTLTGPGLANVDFSIAKPFKLSERINAQLRLEAFNLANHPNFGMPGLTLFTGPSCAAGQSGNCDGAGIRNPNAGRITTTITGPRQFQLGLKLTF